MGKNLDITKPRYSQQILPVPWPLVKSMFHYILFIFFPSTSHARRMNSTRHKLCKEKENC